MIQPPYLEDHTLVVHRLKTPLDLSKATLITSAGFRDVQDWRDRHVVGGTSREKLHEIYKEEFVRIPDGPLAPQLIEFFLVPVWLDGVFWTRLLCADDVTIKSLKKHYSVTLREETNIFYDRNLCSSDLT